MSADASLGSTSTPIVSAPENAVKSVEQLVVHWVKARIDEPLALIDRYDNAARQLISLGGLLQGVYVGIFAVGDTKAVAPLPLLGSLFGTLLVVVFAAAWSICKFPTELNAYGAFRLVQRATTGSDVASAVEQEMQRWCASVDQLARKKHNWLRVATWSLILSFVAAAVLLSRIMKM